MRPKDKIEKYLDRLVKKYNGSVVESDLSRYYSFRGRVLRVSDHIGKNSDGNISIIFDSSDQKNYIIHGHCSGNVSVLNYEQTKEFVRSYCRCSFLFKDITSVSSPPPVSSPKSDREIITNFFKVNFTKGQINQINTYLKQNGKTIKK